MTPVWFDALKSHRNRIGCNAVKSLFIQFALLLVATFAVAQSPSSFEEQPSGTASQITPADLKDIGIDQKLNQPVPLDLQFTDESGGAVRLGDYFHAGRPVILNLVYYTCPMLCSEELAGEASALSMLKFTPGDDYEIVSVSFNPAETPQDASNAKKTYIARINEHLDHKTDGSGWHFLTGQQPQVKQLADAVGFRYHYDPASKQFIHATGIMLVTPRGKIAQYYYGVEFSPKDIRLGLIEASRGNIGNLVDQVLLYCYHYDPKSGRYGAVISNIMRLAGAATMLILGGFLIVMFRRDRPGSSTRASVARDGVADKHGNQGTGRA
jgi:protein SCO1